MGLQVDASRKFVVDARRHYDTSVLRHLKAARAVRRIKLQLAQARYSIRAHTRRRAETTLRAIIQEKLEAGDLPEASAPALYGAPGIGQHCDACDKVLSPTQLVMSVPRPSRKTFAHLHADCFMAWNAVRRSRATLR